MKNHTLEGLKSRARTGWIELGHQRVHGVAVRVENTAITALYVPECDEHLWIMGGQFVNEPVVAEFLHVDYPVRVPEVSTEEALAKFDAYRQTQIQAVSASPADCQRLLWLSQQWTELYAGRDGWLRNTQMLNDLLDMTKDKFLRDKREHTEKGLFRIAEQFLDEERRLALAVLV
ncbi:hypothetical protein [Paraburkholderia sp. C35]|uniref:hypothetical protein n=1 Tax=Paraburkholderia sp. C35 TaxID=2126993 RepID=UPI000D694F76|nr:hypothetical protein [Paraburkholderia sp. C35]